MDNIKIKSNRIILDIPRSENNPRNSEGDFAVLKDGRILFAYCKYSGNSHSDDAPCNIAGMVSDDNGETFRPLDHYLAKASGHAVENIMCASLLRLKNGTLCLFYLCKYNIHTAVYVCRACDDELHFGKPELCTEIDENIYYVVNNCRVHFLPDGSIIIPCALHPVYYNDKGEKKIDYHGKVRYFIGDENAENWKTAPQILEMQSIGHSETGFQEPGITVLPDGRLYSYFRTDRMFQYESFSEDNGKSWSIPVQSKFTSPDSPMLILQNPYSGIFYALWNPIPNYNGRYPKNSPWITAGRTPFVMAQSDNGIDYSEYTVIEDDPERGFCYPAMYFLNEKEILLSYCCGGKDDGNCLTRTRIRKITLQ